MSNFITNLLLIKDQNITMELYHMNQSVVQTAVV